jgi:hypothetical protein
MAHALFMQPQGASMNDPDFQFAVVVILSFVAGFGCAIWLAVALDHDAREMAERMADQPEPIEHG